jgi:hypothetical protein
MYVRMPKAQGFYNPSRTPSRDYLNAYRERDSHLSTMMMVVTMVLVLFFLPLNIARIRITGMVASLVASCDKGDDGLGSNPGQPPTSPCFRNVITFHMTQKTCQSQGTLNWSHWLIRSYDLLLR